jgi:hypothetical protein
VDQPPVSPPPGGQPPQGPDWGDMKNKVTAAQGPDRLILIAGLLYLVDSFLPWYGVKGELGDLVRAAGQNPNIKGWSAGGLAVLAILCAIAATAVAVAGIVGAMAPSPQTATITLALSGGALVFALLRFLTATSATKYGLYIAIVLGAVMAYASYQKYRVADTSKA